MARMSGLGPAADATIVSMPRTCLACSSLTAGIRAKEHVLAEWLLAHLGIAHEALYQGFANSADGTSQIMRTHAVDQFVEGRICDRCNNGWMRQLEETAKPFLVPLIEGERPLSLLSNDERLIVARWAAKTAFVLSYTAVIKPVPLDHIAQLRMVTTLPPQTAVAGALTLGYTRDVSFVRKEHWPQFLGVNENPVMGQPVAYKIGLQIRRLLLVVAHWPAPTATFAIAAGVHVPLWPLGPIYPAYVSPETIRGDPADSFSHLQHLADTFGIVHKPVVSPGNIR